MTGLREVGAREESPDPRISSIPVEAVRLVKHAHLTFRAPKQGVLFDLMQRGHTIAAHMTSLMAAPASEDETCLKQKARPPENASSSRTKGGLVSGVCAAFTDRINDKNAFVAASKIFEPFEQTD